MELQVVNWLHLRQFCTLLIYHHCHHQSVLRYLYHPCVTIIMCCHRLQKDLLVQSCLLCILLCLKYALGLCDHQQNLLHCDHNQSINPRHCQHRLCLIYLHCLILRRLHKELVLCLSLQEQDDTKLMC